MRNEPRCRPRPRDLPGGDRSPRARHWNSSSCSTMAFWRRCGTRTTRWGGKTCRQARRPAQGAADRPASAGHAQHGRGGEAAAHLDVFYRQVTGRVLDANLDGDRQHLAEAIRLSPRCVRPGNSSRTSPPCRLPRLGEDRRRSTMTETADDLLARLPRGARPRARALETLLHSPRPRTPRARPAMPMRCWRCWPNAPPPSTRSWTSNAKSPAAARRSPASSAARRHAPRHPSKTSDSGIAWRPSGCHALTATTADPGTPRAGRVHPPRLVADAGAAEATLAAYRKALAPPESRSGLIDRRG